MKPARKPAHKDADPRYFAAVIRVALTPGLDFIEAAKVVFEDDLKLLTKEQATARAKTIAKTIEYRHFQNERPEVDSTDRSRPLPTVAQWIILQPLVDEDARILGDYQLCAACGRYLFVGDRALVAPVVSGVHHDDGTRGKPYLTYLCKECADGDKRNWTRRWKEILEMDRCDRKAFATFFDGNCFLHVIRPRFCQEPVEDPVPQKLTRRLHSYVSASSRAEVSLFVEARQAHTLRQVGKSRIRAQRLKIGSHTEEDQTAGAILICCFQRGE